MTSPSPGPWKVVIAKQHTGDSLVSVIDLEGNTVCDNETYYPQALDPRNANLIAAAPHMLKALSHLFSLFSHKLSAEAAEECYQLINRAKGEA